MHKQGCRTLLHNRVRNSHDTASTQEHSALPPPACDYSSVPPLAALNLPTTWMAFQRALLLRATQLQHASVEVIVRNASRVLSPTYSTTTFAAQCPVANDYS